MPDAVGAANTDVPTGLPGACAAGAAGEEIGRVGDGVTVGEGAANRFGKIAITVKTSTSPKIRIKRVCGFFMATRFQRDVAACELESHGADRQVSRGFGLERKGTVRVEHEQSPG